MTTKKTDHDEKDDPKPKAKDEKEPTEKASKEPVHLMHQRIEREAVGN